MLPSCMEACCLSQHVIKRCIILISQQSVKKPSNNTIAWASASDQLSTLTSFQNKSCCRTHVSLNLGLCQEELNLSHYSPAHTVDSKCFFNLNLPLIFAVVAVIQCWHFTQISTSTTSQSQQSKNKTVLLSCYCV